MRQESNHFTVMKTEMYVNMSSSNSVNLLRKYLVLDFNPEGFQVTDS